jgi:hypothetical protein
MPQARRRTAPAALPAWLSARQRSPPACGVSQGRSALTQQACRTAKWRQQATTRQHPKFGVESSVRWFSRLVRARAAGLQGQHSKGNKQQQGDVRIEKQRAVVLKGSQAMRSRPAGAGEQQAWYAHVRNDESFAVSPPMCGGCQER